MRLPSLARFVGGAALVFAAVVLVHGTTCRVLHGTTISDAPSGSHVTGDHLPKAVAEGATAAALAALFGLLVLRLVRRPPTDVVTSGQPSGLRTGRAPPDRFCHDPRPSIALCVFRC